MPVRLIEALGKFVVNDVFEVVVENKALTVNKLNYFLGEFANVSYSSPNNVPFQSPTASAYSLRIQRNTNFLAGSRFI